MRQRGCVLASLLVLEACASEPRRPPSSLDPSNPDAPEAPPAALPGALVEPVPSPSAEPAVRGHANHGAEAASRGEAVPQVRIFSRVSWTTSPTAPGFSFSAARSRRRMPGPSTSISVDAYVSEPKRRMVSVWSFRMRTS